MNWVFELPEKQLGVSQKTTNHRTRNYFKKQNVPIVVQSLKNVTNYVLLTSIKVGVYIYPKNQLEIQ